MGIEWEEVTINTWRFKVDGGYLYHNEEEGGNTMCFVPDVDLQRYQSHLRDAYTQGFNDGQEHAKNEIYKKGE